MLAMHSSEMVTLLVFRKHVSKNLRIMDDQNSFIDECVKKVGKKIMQESRALKSEFKSLKKHIDRDLASVCISETLMKLLSLISSKFENSLQSLMVGNIISSVITCQSTHLQISIGVLWWITKCSLKGCTRTMSPAHNMKSIDSKGQQLSRSLFY
jgi:hypothetical protein